MWVQNMSLEMEGRRFVYFEEKDRRAEQRHDGDKTNHMGNLS